MKQELATITTSEIMSIGKAFAESGMFKDISSAAMAIVKIQAGAEIGIPPFAAMTGIHIIQGKPAIGAGLMASTVKASGKYDYRVVQASEILCSIDFFQGKEKLGNSSFSIEDAKKAGTQNLAKYPKNMLFARAMSNGVKWFTPDVFAGPVYTPEEFDVTVDTEHEVVETTDADKAQELAHYIEKLVECQTVADLKEYKNTMVPAYIVCDASFVKAGKERYNVIMATPVK